MWPQVSPHRLDADANVSHHTPRPGVVAFDEGSDLLQYRFDLTTAGTLRGGQCSANQKGAEHDQTPASRPVHRECSVESSVLPAPDGTFIHPRTAEATVNLKQAVLSRTLQMSSDP